MLLSTGTAEAVETTANTFIEDLFNSPIAAEAFSFRSAIIMLGASLLLGLLVALSYIWTQKRCGGDITLSISLIIVPAVVTLIIMLIGNSYARAFTLAGAFSIIRYRSMPASPKDISYVFLTLAIGLACGMGYVSYAVLFALALILIMIIISVTGFGTPKMREMQLKVVIPENMNFNGLLDDLLTADASYWKLKKIKSSDFGTMFELIYTLRLKKETDTKEFIDKIRCRNGNLNVTLTLAADEVRE